jgi:2,5-diketo-D-gluconate reductase A
VQDTGEEHTRRAFDASLQRLGLDYLDLYLIHQPYGDVYGSWRAMQNLNSEGRVRAIGVSNFYPDRLVDLIEHHDVTPPVNQIETHPFFQRAADQEIMRDRGVQIESWGPFAEGKNNRMAQNLDVFDFALTGEQMARIAAMDTGRSLFFDHRDPAMVSRLSNVRIHD